MVTIGLPAEVLPGPHNALAGVPPIPSAAADVLENQKVNLRRPAITSGPVKPFDHARGLLYLYPVTF